MDLMFPSGGSSDVELKWGYPVYITATVDNNDTVTYQTTWIDTSLITIGTGVINKTGTVTVIVAVNLRNEFVDTARIVVKKNGVEQTKTEYASGGLYRRYTFDVVVGDTLAITYNNLDATDVFAYAAVFLDF